MPTTRKKVVKTVYKDEDDSETGDFSDSGSEAVISDTSSSEDEDDHETNDSPEHRKKIAKSKSQRPKKSKFVKKFIAKVIEHPKGNLEDDFVTEPIFSAKDLTAADKLLPSILNLSDSDSSDDEAPRTSTTSIVHNVLDTEDDVKVETCSEYKDVWSHNLKQCEEIAKNTFLELEQHRTKLEETKLSIEKYKLKKDNAKESDVKHLLALGEEKTLTPTKTMRKKHVKAKNDSDSEMEDWEEVAEGKEIPQQGIELVVGFLETESRKTKKVDKQMMIKRRINRVKKEYQIYMHKVHVLCWLGHGNFVSHVLNDRDVMSAVLSLIPSKECYPNERVDLKYIEQITTWYHDKLSLKIDKNEGKFRPKAPPLKNLLLDQIKNRIITSKKYFVFIFVSMLRAIGLQCRIMLNFTTVPLKPPNSELCSLSTKQNSNDKSKKGVNIKKEGEENVKNTKKTVNKHKDSDKIPQMDGNYDCLNDDYFDNIIQLDGNDDTAVPKPKHSLALKTKKQNPTTLTEDISPPKRSRRNQSTKKNNLSSRNDELSQENISNIKNDQVKTKQKPVTRNSLSLKRNSPVQPNLDNSRQINTNKKTGDNKTRKCKCDIKPGLETKNDKHGKKKVQPPIITVTHSDTNISIASQYFDNGEESKQNPKVDRSRKRSHTSNPNTQQDGENNNADKIKKSRAKSVPGKTTDKSKYFHDNVKELSVTKKRNIKNVSKLNKSTEIKEDAMRISHKELVNAKAKPANDVTNDLVDIIKKRVKEAKVQTKKELTEVQKTRASTSKVSSKPGPSRKVDRRVFSTDDEVAHPTRNKVDTWCEVFVEELEQWVAVDVINARTYCSNEIYNRATHPVAYVVGWDNNNYLKDLTRRYVPHWNTVTRKQRVDSVWWMKAIHPWLGPKTPKDKKEDDQLDRMQLEAPLPKSIAEYKNHPLYALKRHLLKFEAIYPPDAATLGFVRGEPVYARECVYTCRSRDTWLKEAKVVRLGETPYKVVKARPKWDKLSNKMITDKPLEVFGPWQVQEYEPPCAENGIVPRNAYGNVELFKECMLPKGTIHIKLPGLNRVARKLNIDCAPAMTGFEFNGGWSHPVYDGFVVCEEYKDIITNAWHEDQEDQMRKEREKTETRVYGNWKRLIKKLIIREQLEHKYKFSQSTSSQDKSAKKTSKGPRLATKKK